MSHGTDIDRFIKDPILLVDLFHEVIERLDAGENNTEAAAERAAMEAQLREIAKAVEKLEKMGVPVPDPLRAEKTRLAAALGVKDEKTQTLTNLAEALGGVLREIRTRLQQRQPQPLGGKMQPERVPSDRLPRSVLREATINALQVLGGRSPVKSIFDEMAQQLEGRFLPGDLVWLESTKKFAWQNAVKHERPKMVDEGILRGDSPKGVWELSEDHR